MRQVNVRDGFLDVFANAGFRKSPGLSLLQPSIKTSFLFSVGFVDVLAAIAGNATELDGAATVQRCFRHFDVDRVGDGRHLSLFEMAGALRCSNWTVEDLAVPLVQYLLQVCNLPQDRLHATFFNGDDVSGNFLEPDHQARFAYLTAGIEPQNIWPGNHSTNIWSEGANSGTERSGICGPHSEIFFDLAPEGNEAPGAGPLTHPERFLEVSNIVTITHQTCPGSTGGILPLPKPLVELAMGMERIEMAMGGLFDIHQTPKLHSIAQAVRAAFASTPKEAAQKPLRIAVDHVRALTHLIADGGRPGPKGQGHVVRRLFRGLLEAGDMLQLDLCEAFPQLAQTVAQVDAPINPNLVIEMDNVIAIFVGETQRMLAQS